MWIPGILSLSVKSNAPGEIVAAGDHEGNIVVVVGEDVLVEDRRVWRVGMMGSPRLLDGSTVDDRFVRSHLNPMKSRHVRIDQKK